MKRLWPHYCRIDQLPAGRIRIAGGLFLVLLLALSGALRPAQAQDIEFFATVDRSALQITQTLTLTIQAEGSVSSLPDPTWPSFTGFRVISGPNESSTFQIINGKYSVVKSWSFILKPERTGPLTIGPATLKYKKETYQTEAIPIVVDGSGTPITPAPRTGEKSSQSAGPPELFVKIEADKSSLYQNEQVILTYTIYTRVSVNTYEISRLPSTPGFWTEEFKLPQQPSVQDEVIEGRHYRKAVIRRVALFPTRAGKLTIDPLEVTCQVQVQDTRKKRRDPFDILFDSPFSRLRTEERFVETEPLALNVKALPAAGKPQNFSGAVGDFSLEVSLDRDHVKAHEAITMTVQFSGTGNIKLLPQPNFAVPPDFEGYDPKESVKVNKSGHRVFGSKTFEYVLIPRVPGVGQIPPVEFTYFDPQSKSYRTLTKGGFEVLVERGDGTVSAAVPGVSREEVKLLAEDIRYLKTPGRLLQIGSAYRLSPAYWLGVVLPPILAALLWWVAKLMGAPSLQARRKDRKVYARVLKELQALGRQQSSDTTGEAAAYGSVHRILLQYLGHRLNIPASGLKEEEVIKRLRDQGTDNEVQSTLQEIFEECNLARFAPQGTDDWQLNRIIKRSVRVIDKFEGTSGAKKKSKLPLGLFLLTLWMAGHVTFSAAQQESDPRLAEDFYRNGDYTAAISAYEELIDQGVNGEIYYNLGNCYYQLGEYGHAILNYERAKKYLGNDADLNHNLKLANLRIYDKIEPLPRIFLIKAYEGFAGLLTVKGWGRLFLLAEWLLLACLAGLYLLHKPTFRRFVVWGFFLAFFVGLLSGGVLVEQKIRHSNLTEGIVLSTSVEARSAPEAASTELFTLHEGVKVRVLRQVAGWAEIRLLDGKRGWVPLESFDVI